ncbi:hypothetical protein F5884DRAFT_254874 [Xylogone sp. PMI_703]|nr:hypothetical protein F5884DRAFT_254874 [Xylogone sp. PMI_703]
MMDPFFKRTPAVPIASIPGSLPVATIPPDIDHDAVATKGLELLSALKLENLTEEVIWRDQWALTGTSRTFFSPNSVFSAWSELRERHKPDRFTLIPGQSRTIDGSLNSSWIQASFKFETTGHPTCLCSGFIGLVPNKSGGWSIWMLSTILEALKQYASPDVLPPQPAVAVNENGTLADINEYNFDCVVVGAGMAGLSTAGRLKALGVSSLTVEKNAHIGDNWTMRYESAKLHTSREYGHLPFSRTFPPEDGYYLTASQLARGFQRFAEMFKINVWLSSTVESASWVEQKKTWRLLVRRQGRTETINTRHVVLCMGAGGQIPRMPVFPNKHTFRGILLHSADYKSSKEWRGMTGVVIGSANTAHDVASDMVEAGLASVTMVQRNATAVIPERVFNSVNDVIYNENVPTEVADRLSFGLPLAVTRLLAIQLAHAEIDKDPESYNSLERVGFKLDRYTDPSVFINERLGGHHLDVGAAERIRSGQIKMKSDSSISGYTSTGLAFSDGSTLDADVIIVCTGFEGNMRQAAARIFGLEVEKGLEDFWGVDAEGEIIGAWKRQGYPGIWYHGGTIGHARYFSRFLALQIKADIEGIPLPLYCI